LLAAEALAIGSLFRSTDAVGGILCASFCLLVGAGGGALAARLVPMREPSPREDSVLATTAAAVCIVAFSVGVLGANRVGPFHSLRPHSEAVLPAPEPHCGSGERSSDIDPPRMSFSLLTPRVRPTDPVRVRYRLQFTNKQVDATR